MNECQCQSAYSNLRIFVCRILRLAYFREFQTRDFDCIAIFEHATICVFHFNFILFLGIYIFFRNLHFFKTVEFESLCGFVETLRILFELKSSNTDPCTHFRNFYIVLTLGHGEVFLKLIDKSRKSDKSVRITSHTCVRVYVVHPQVVVAEDRVEYSPGFDHLRYVSVKIRN